jgi:hypothetical protein
MNRLGGLEWAQRSGGNLTRRERARLLGAIAAGQVEFTLGRIKQATGRLPAGARSVDAASMQPPDSALAREAEKACAEQGESIIGHSYRTWLYGTALAHVDRTALDPELFYAAALVHVHGIEHTKEGRCFTVASAERALRLARAANISEDDAERIGDAITVHATPGATVERDGAIGVYVQQGAIADLAGMRRWDVTPENREAIVARHPRGTVKADITRLVTAESKAVPDGRFALLRRCGFLLLVRLDRA